MSWITTLTADVSEEHRLLDLVRKILIRVLWISFLVGVGAVSYYQLTRSDVLPIKQIAFKGEFAQLEVNDMQPIVENVVSGNFFTLNVADLYQRLLALPWVKQVWIHRVWPDKINVNVQEQMPIGVLKGRGLINQEGDVFASSSQIFEEKLVLFDVAETFEKKAIQYYQQYVDVLRSTGLKIKSYHFNIRNSQSIIFTNGLELKLGKQDTKNRMTLFVLAYAKNIGPKVDAIKRLDFRYTNGFAVQWKEL